MFETYYHEIFTTGMPPLDHLTLNEIWKIKKCESYRRWRITESFLQAKMQ